MFTWYFYDSLTYFIRCCNTIFYFDILLNIKKTIKTLVGHSQPIFENLSDYKQNTTQYIKSASK